MPPHFKPVLVLAGEKALDELNIPQELREYKNVYNFGCIGGFKVNVAEQLFPRLDPKVELPFITGLMKQQ